jgi:hypothetical protein
MRGGVVVAQRWASVNKWSRTRLMLSCRQVKRSGHAQSKQLRVKTATATLLIILPCRSLFVMQGSRSCIASPRQLFNVPPNPMLFKIADNVERSTWRNTISVVNSNCPHDIFNWLQPSYLSRTILDRMFTWSYSDVTGVFQSLTHEQQNGSSFTCLRHINIRLQHLA